MNNEFKYHGLGFSVDHNLVMIEDGLGNSNSYQIGDNIQSRELLFVGCAANTPIAVFQGMENNEIIFVSKDKAYVTRINKLWMNAVQGVHVNNRQSIDVILDSGEDVLAKTMFSQEEASFEAVLGLLPRIHKNQYSFIGSTVSWSCVRVLPNGDIIPQESECNASLPPIFSPVELDNILSDVTPEQYLINGWMPIIVSNYEADEKAMSLLYFIEPNDDGSYPIIWIRAQILDKKTNKRIFDELFIVSNSRSCRRKKVTAELFWDAYFTTISYWDNYEKEMCSIKIPDEYLSLCVKGCSAKVITTFSGEHAHYGHRWYGWDIHNNFPPTYLTAIETFFTLGMMNKARKYAEHVMEYCIDLFGRFSYKQGDKGEYAASGAEYGQWLWLIIRLEGVLPPRNWIAPYLCKMIKIGEFLLSNRNPVPEANGKGLINMCAEADLNNRVYAYSHNNLWAIHGLKALGELLNKYHRPEASVFLEEAEDLEIELRAAFDEFSVESKYGRIVPFQFGYTATPLTLSKCKDTFYPVKPEDLLNYYNSASGIRDAIKGEQDLSENSYANYRYYPEMLSTMLLKQDEADAILKMRESIGGECLGTSRLFSCVDDWPMANYARFLLSTDRIDKYLLLMYSHMAHHGIPGMMVYFEQISLDGAVLAPDCVPTILLIPIMFGWMFCFEPPCEQAIYLLRGIPSSWLSSGSEICVENIGCTFGSVGVKAKRNGDLIDISLNMPENIEDVDFYLDLRLPQGMACKRIAAGKEYIGDVIKGNRYALKNTSEGKIKLSFEI